MSVDGAAQTTPIAAFIPDLDSLVADAMAEWKIPGLAIAVVQNREVALLKAYGQRDIEADLPVTTDTQFLICSITKTFTATALALLVDQGRQPDLGRPQGRPPYRLLPHRETAQSRAAAVDRFHGVVFSGEDRARLGGLDPGGGDPRRIGSLTQQEETGE